MKCMKWKWILEDSFDGEVLFKLSKVNLLVIGCKEGSNVEDIIKFDVI